MVVQSLGRGLMLGALDMGILVKVLLLLVLLWQAVVRVPILALVSPHGAAVGEQPVGLVCLLAREHLPHRLRGLGTIVIDGLLLEGNIMVGGNGGRRGAQARVLLSGQRFHLQRRVTGAQVQVVDQRHGPCCKALVRQPFQASNEKVRVIKKVHHGNDKQQNHTAFSCTE
ncbi:hypothetical protein JZ751_020971 [Albula glossodonta]|uniref:Uncharacterized protein n=1 Tax=Albula glossodonta TaxID=121402 RepID=A0A8T2PNW0_9TELE|nr:hypothetical protein JZ751_020971 [Albula glossodonta]